MTEEERKKFIQNRVQEHYEEACSLGREVVGVWLNGSQNYGVDIYTDEYQSDVDTKCIVLPNIDEIVKGLPPYSHTHVTAKNEHIDIKDIREMFKMFKKQNSSYIEILFTDYYVINPKYKDLVQELMDHAENIAHININLSLKCFVGTSKQKLKNLEHPFPNAIEKIKKYGYDPKQLHHLVRINEMICKYGEGRPYQECLKTSTPRWLIELKTNANHDEIINKIRSTADKDVSYKTGLEAIEEFAQKLDRDTVSVKDRYLQDPVIVDNETINFLDDLCARFIKKFLTEQIMNEKVLTKENILTIFKEKYNVRLENKIDKEHSNCELYGGNYDYTRSYIFDKDNSVRLESKNFTNEWSVLEFSPEELILLGQLGSIFKNQGNKND